MTEDEKYVREHWEWVSYFEPDADCDIAIVQVANKKAEDIRDFTSPQPVEAWSAAAEFTRTRLEQIRDVEEEIHCLGYYETFQRSAGAKLDADIVKRIHAREQAALADLKRGLRVAE